MLWTLKLCRSLHILPYPRYHVNCWRWYAHVTAFTFPYTALPTTLTAVVDSWVAHEIWHSLSFENIDIRTNCYHSSGRDDSWHSSPVSSFVLLWKHCIHCWVPLDTNVVLPCYLLGSRKRYKLLCCLRMKWEQCHSSPHYSFFDSLKFSFESNFLVKFVLSISILF